MIWKLADAKSKFSQVVRQARLEGPQRSERRNDAVYLVSEAEYRRLSGDKPSLVDVKSSPTKPRIELAFSSSPLKEAPQIDVKPQIGSWPVEEEPRVDAKPQVGSSPLEDAPPMDVSPQYGSHPEST